MIYFDKDYNPLKYTLIKSSFLIFRLARKNIELFWSQRDCTVHMQRK